MLHKGKVGHSRSRQTRLGSVVQCVEKRRVYVYSVKKSSEVWMRERGERGSRAESR